MTTPPRTLRVYATFLRLYPRRFRQEYGPDLVQLVADQLRDEAAWRVIPRTVIDLTLTVPTRHLEAHMDRTPTGLVPIMFGTAALSAVIVGAVVGHPFVLLACLTVAVATGALGLLAAHRARPLTQPYSATTHWWKLLAGGGALLAALIAITTATGELPDAGWLIAMLTGLIAIVLMAAGIVLGIAHAAARTQRRPAA